jgi:ABC-type Fe3+/spermidine/putrescine transport system ATPase subunit
VADFVGQTNMYPAKFLQSDGAYASLKLDNDLLLTARNNPKCSGIKSGAAVILWMRTQSLHVWRNEPPDRANGNLLSAVVANKSYQGDSTCYFLKGAGNPDLIIKVSSSNNGQEAFSVGDQVFVEIPADNISFFATEECAKSVIEPSGIEFNGKRSLGTLL